MKRSFRKDIFRTIRSSLGRFFAIFSIVFTGVAFFAGVMATSPNMRKTADSYFDDYRLSDIRVISTIGFNDSDVEALRKIEGIRGIYPEHRLDVLMKTSDSESEAVGSITSIPNDITKANDSEDYINRIRLKEGRFPERSNECLVRVSAASVQPIAVGDTLLLSSGTEDPLSDHFSEEKLTVVGLCYVPTSISFTLGTSTVGNGTISYLLYVPESAFADELYTGLSVTVLGASDKDTFSDSYFDIVNPIRDAIQKEETRLIENRMKEAEDTVIIEVSEQVTEEVTKKVREEVTKAMEASVPEIMRVQMGEAYQLLLDEKVEEEIEKVLPGKIEEVYIDEWAKIKPTFEEASWYVLDRNSEMSYVEYRNAADQMEKIAIIFPIFFFFVAALVCFTTMTRMIFEERTSIGVYKALGYSGRMILVKYIFYSLLAAIPGGVIGCAVGMWIFPTVIFNAWGIAYQMPTMLFADNTILAVCSVLSMTLVILLSVFAACIKDLKAVPASVMRPKPPKHGKSVFLEKIPFFWNRLSFSKKVAIRNVFRYKKRFFMTLAGVAGCTALLVTGFGISDSIEHLVSAQFEEIDRYDISVQLKPAADDHSIRSLEAYEEWENIVPAIAEKGLLNREKESLKNDEGERKKDCDITIYVAEGEDILSAFLLRDSRTKENCEIPDEGILLSQITADRYDLKEGDDLYIENEKGLRKKVTIAKVIEYHVGDVAFLSRKYYHKIFGAVPSINLLLGREKEGTDESELGKKLLAEDSVSSVTFLSQTITNIRRMIEALKIITWVLILSSAILSFIVLYNLTNVTIAERIREIATLKVLGFYDRETESYIYREFIAITLFGALFGLLLGVLLHHTIMNTIAVGSISFGKYIAPLSFLWSFLLTVLFSFFVRLFVKKKLRNIPMVESLKSVE